MLKCNYTEKKRQGNRKKSLPVLRFERPTAYICIMYDNHHAIEAIINKCRFFFFFFIYIYIHMRMCVN